MAAALKFSMQPYIHYFNGKPRAYNPLAHGKYIAVVMLAGGLRAEAVVAKRRPNPGNLISRYIHPYTRTAD